MAALRYGIHTVIIPKDNEADLTEIDPIVRNALNFIAAESVGTVLDVALNKSETSPTILGTIPDKLKSKSHNTTIQQ